MHFHVRLVHSFFLSVAREHPATYHFILSKLIKFSSFPSPINTTQKAGATEKTPNILIPNFACLLCQNENGGLFPNHCSHKRRQIIFLTVKSAVRCVCQQLPKYFGTTQIPNGGQQPSSYSRRRDIHTHVKISEPFRNNVRSRVQTCLTQPQAVYSYLADSAGASPSSSPSASTPFVSLPDASSSWKFSPYVPIISASSFSLAT